MEKQEIACNTKSNIILVYRIFSGAGGLTKIVCEAIKEKSSDDSSSCGVFLVSMSIKLNFLKLRSRKLVGDTLNQLKKIFKFFSLLLSTILEF